MRSAALFACLLLLNGCSLRQLVFGPAPRAAPAQQREIDFYRILILGRSVNAGVLSEHTSALDAQRITSHQYGPALEASERVKSLFDDAERFQGRMAAETGPERRRAAELLLKSALAQAIRELARMRRDSKALQITTFDALLLSHLAELEAFLPDLEGSDGKTRR